MCGISVLIDRTGLPVERRLIEQMNQRVLHRGPDDEGVFLGASFGLGHRRLSILDVSSAGHQPMAFRDRSVVTYNGEIYNYVELRAELKQQGYAFATSCDTEVLLAAYDCWGEACVQRFNGMWSFALWDARRNVLFCSRDRFGVKPLQYLELPRYFAIASEAKQFLAVPGFTPRADAQVAYRYLVHGELSVGERGFFAGVRELRGGHNLVYDLTRGSYRITRWYDLTRVACDETVRFDHAAERFAELFLDAVRVRLRSDVAVGACLSGGIDSSAIVGAVRAVSGSASTLATVSAAWDDPTCDETRYIDVVSAATAFRAIRTWPRMEHLLARGTLAKIIYHQDQPILSASHFAEYSVFETARAHGLPVMLDGQGADEYLAGYSSFFPPFLRGQLARGRVMTGLREVVRRSQLRRTSVLPGLLSLLGAMASPVRQRMRLVAPRRPPHVEDDWLGSDLVRAGEGVDTAVEPVATSIREFSLRQLLATSIPYQLHSEDRNSMLHSIESRLPFLDYRLVEFALSLPDEFKIRGGATKAIARHALRGVLPPAIAARHDKLGFPAPERRWFTQEAPALRVHLADAVGAYPGLFRAPLLQRFDAMVAGQAAYSPLFFRVIAFRHWAEAFAIERPL